MQGGKADSAELPKEGKELTFIAEFEQALTNYYEAEERADEQVRKRQPFTYSEELKDALENERICAERLGKLVARHLRELNVNKGRCCE